MKGKIIAIYACLGALIVALIILGTYLYFTKKDIDKIAEETLEHKIATQEQEVMTLVKKEEELEANLQVAKEEIKKTLEDYKKVKHIYKGEDYTQVMLVLSILEAKLVRGGSIKNEVIRLRGLLEKNPDITFFLNTFQNVTELTSRKDLKIGYENYVKIAKSEILLNTESKYQKVLGFISKYFAILNLQKKEDKILIDIGEALNIDDYVLAYENTTKLNTTSLEALQFLQNLHASSLVQAGVNDIYFLISNKLSEEK